MVDLLVRLVSGWVDHAAHSLTLRKDAWPSRRQMRFRLRRCAARIIGKTPGNALVNREMTFR
jgi:hypothetical protein